MIMIVIIQMNIVLLLVALKHLRIHADSLASDVVTVPQLLLFKQVVSFNTFIHYHFLLT